MRLLDSRIKSENDRKEEQGRSMVEMLGTLAIIGVLSVGSIAGYRYAMDNYYTNEILAGASQRAVLVAAQIASGREPSLKEFDKIETAGGEFDGTIKKWDGEFGIQVTKVKESVCENLIKATEDTDIIITDTNGVDLAESDCSGDENTFMFVYSNDMGTTDTDSGCFGGLPMCGTQCCAEGTYCTRDGSDKTAYTCAEPSGDGDCTKNSDCKDAEGNVDTTKYCKLAASDCSGPTGGTCTDKGELDDTNDFTVKTLNLPGGDLTVYKGGQMNWWSASNLCQAHGKQLVTMADLGVSDNGQNYCYFDSAKRVYNSKDETWQCNCIGDSGCTTTTTEIYDKLGTSDFVWLADNSKAGPCGVRFVRLTNAYVYHIGRQNDYSALCRDP